MSLAFKYTVLVHIIHSKLVNIILATQSLYYCYKLPYSTKHRTILLQAAVHSPKSSQETESAREKTIIAQSVQCDRALW